MEHISSSFLSRKAAIIIIIVFLLGIVSLNFYDINQFYPYAKLGATISFIILSLLTFFISDLKSEIVYYLKNAYQEATKVVWPQKNEVFKITLIVFIFVIIMGAFLWIVDTSLGWLVYDIILGWK